MSYSTALLCKIRPKTRKDSQERALRIVFWGKSARCEELLKKAGLTTLYNQRLQDIAIMMYNVKHKLLSSYVVNIFEENETSWSFGMKTTLRYRDFREISRYQGPYLWSGSIFVV